MIAALPPRSVSSSVHMCAVRGIPASDPHQAKPGAHYSPERAYASSKLAQILFTAELNRRLGPASPVKVRALELRWPHCLVPVHQQRGCALPSAALSLLAAV